jgi:hypothetical protein
MNATRSVGKIAALALAAMLAAAAEPARAQLAAPLTVDVPFAFVAGKKSLPAGTYVIKPLSGSVLLVRDVEGKTAAIVATTASDAREPASRTEVAFARYGDVYFLAEVRPAASTQYQRLARTRSEERLARGMSRPEHVTLVASPSR